MFHFSSNGPSADVRGFAATNLRNRFYVSILMTILLATGCQPAPVVVEDEWIGVEMNGGPAAITADARPPRPTGGGNFSFEQPVPSADSQTQLQSINQAASDARQARAQALKQNAAKLAETRWQRAEALMETAAELRRLYHYAEARQAYLDAREEFDSASRLAAKSQARSEAEEAFAKVYEAAPRELIERYLPQQWAAIERLRESAHDEQDPARAKQLLDEAARNLADAESPARAAEAERMLVEDPKKALDYAADLLVNDPGNETATRMIREGIKRQPDWFWFKAESLCENADDAYQRASGRLVLGYCCYEVHRNSEGARHFECCLQQAKNIADTGKKLDMMCWLATNADYFGESAIALNALHYASQLLRSVNHRFPFYGQDVQVAGAAAAIGDDDAWLVHAAQTLEKSKKNYYRSPLAIARLFREVGELQGVEAFARSGGQSGVLAYGWLVEEAAERGDVAAVERALMNINAQADEVSSKEDRDWLWMRVGMAHALTGKLDLARELSQQVKDFRRPYVQRSIAEYHAKQGEMAEAREILASLGNMEWIHGASRLIARDLLDKPLDEQVRWSLSFSHPTAKVTALGTLACRGGHVANDQPKPATEIPEGTTSWSGRMLFPGIAESTCELTVQRSGTQLTGTIRYDEDQEAAVEGTVSGSWTVFTQVKQTRGKSLWIPSDFYLASVGDRLYGVFQSRNRRTREKRAAVAFHRSGAPYASTGATPVVPTEKSRWHQAVEQWDTQKLRKFDPSAWAQISEHVDQATSAESDELAEDHYKAARTQLFVLAKSMTAKSVQDALDHGKPVAEHLRNAFAVFRGHLETAEPPSAVLGAPGSSHHERAETELKEQVAWWVAQATRELAEISAPQRGIALGLAAKHASVQGEREAYDQHIQAAMTSVSGNAPAAKVAFQQFVYLIACQIFAKDKAGAKEALGRAALFAEEMGEERLEACVMLAAIAIRLGDEQRFEHVARLIVSDTESDQEQQAAIARAWALAGVPKRATDMKEPTYDVLAAVALGAVENSDEPMFHRALAMAIQKRADGESTAIGDADLVAAVALNGELEEAEIRAGRLDQQTIRERAAPLLATCFAKRHNLPKAKAWLKRAAESLNAVNAAGELSYHVVQADQSLVEHLGWIEAQASPLIRCSAYFGVAATLGRKQRDAETTEEETKAKVL